MAFHDVVFPARLAFGARGGPQWRTDVVRLAAGHEKRNARWSRPRRAYDVGTGVKSLADLAELVAFFEARGGRLHAFRFADPLDSSSAVPGAEPAPNDQPFGTGDGATTVFQLRKGARDITKPRTGAVRVAVDGAEVAPSAFSVDALTGLVTFAVAPSDGAALAAGFRFDVPVRFDTDTLQVSLESFRAGEVPAIALVEVFE